MPIATTVSLEAELRRKAEKELQDEIRRDFLPLSRYFSGSLDRVTLTVTPEVNTSIIRASGHPNGFVVRIDELLSLLTTKALRNERDPRGDSAVLEFLRRVEDVADQIDSLRKES